MKRRWLNRTAAPPILVTAALLAAGHIAGQETPPPPPSAQQEPAPQRPPEQPIDARGYYQRAVAAYQRKDYIAFLENMQQAVQLAPERPDYRFRLAAASALVGNKEDAFAQLRRLADMKVYEELAGNPDFDTLKDTPEMIALVERMKGLRARVGSSQPAFHLQEKDLIPEGLAHDPGSGDFFIGSVHKRKIVRASKRGKAKDFTAEKQDGLWAVLGIKVDASRRLLWACSSAVPQMKDARPEELGRAALFEYNVDTGAFLGKRPLGGGATGHNCNDLTLDARGDVYVSDSESGEVLALPAGAGDFSVVVPAGQLRSPQGLAFSDDGKHLFVADYALGLWRVETATGAMARMGSPDDVSLVGIDGLVFWKGSLIAVQNGITPNRVVLLTLSPSMDAVQSAAILEMSNALFDEPTLGTLLDKRFFYVANSQWGRFEKDGTIFPLNRLAEPTILRIDLDQSRPLSGDRASSRR